MAEEKKDEKKFKVRAAARRAPGMHRAGLFVSRDEADYEVTQKQYDELKAEPDIIVMKHPEVGAPVQPPKPPQSQQRR